MLEFLKTIHQNPTFQKIAILIVGFILIRVILRLIQQRLFIRIKENSTRYRAQKASNFTAYFLIILLASIIYRNNLGGFTVVLGVMGAGIAFALQEMLSSVAAWIAILFGEYYKPGDRIKLGGVVGDVMDIGILRTTIMETGQWVDGDLYNGRIVFIANSFLFKEPVYNYSGDFPFLWDEIKVLVKFGSNYEKAQSMLLEIAQEVVGNLPAESLKKWKSLQNEYHLEDAQTMPFVSLTANENWVEYTLRYVVHFKKRRKTKTDLFLKILRQIEATNGEIKFATSTIHIVETPEINVNLKSIQP